MSSQWATEIFAVTQRPITGGCFVDASPIKTAGPPSFRARCENETAPNSTTTTQAKLRWINGRQKWFQKTLSNARKWLTSGTDFIFCKRKKKLSQLREIKISFFVFSIWLGFKVGYLLYLLVLREQAIVCFDPNRYWWIVYTLSLLSVDPVTAYRFLLYLNNIKCAGIREKPKTALYNNKGIANILLRCFTQIISPPMGFICFRVNIFDRAFS